MTGNSKLRFFEYRLLKCRYSCVKEDIGGIDCLVEEIKYADRNPCLQGARLNSASTYQVPMVC